jgi:hypothetical protein
MNPRRVVHIVELSVGFTETKQSLQLPSELSGQQAMSGYVMGQVPELRGEVSLHWNGKRLNLKQEL